MLLSILPRLVQLLASSLTWDSITLVSARIFPWPCSPCVSGSSPGGFLIFEEHQSYWFRALANGLISA